MDMADAEGSINNDDIGNDASPSMKDVTRILNAIEQGESESNNE
jgi:hypothetical protein